VKPISTPQSHHNIGAALAMAEPGEQATFVKRVDQMLDGTRQTSNRRSRKVLNFVLAPSTRAICSRRL
jgi:hypothetical protein